MQRKAKTPCLADYISSALFFQRKNKRKEKEKLVKPHHAMLNLAAVGTKLLLPLCLAELAQNCRIRAGGNERPRATAVKQPGLQ